MGVNKLIKFYIIEAIPSIKFADINIDENLYEFFKCGFKNVEDFYKIIFEKKELFFDIKEMNKTFLFGTCSTAEEIKATSMILSRDLKTNQAKPYTLDSEDRLEAYTFFYIDFKSHRMATIANKKISKVNEAICRLIDVYSKSTARVSIYLEKDTDVKRTIEKLSVINNIEIEFKSEKNPAEIDNVFKTMKSDFNVDKYKLKLKISKTSPFFIERLMDIKKSASESKLSKLNVFGKNDLGVDEVINLIETICAKTVPLELTDDTVKNTEKVKEKLKSAIDTHLESIS